MKINKTGKSLCLTGLFLFLLTIFSDFLRGRRFFIGYAQLVFIGFCVLLIVIGFFFGSSQTWVFVRKICLGVIQKARRINWASFFSVLLFIVLIAAAIYPIKFLWGYYSFPYPYEVRDAAGISVAFDFSRGINPYTIQNFPQNMYIYGFMYPLILSPFINQSVHPILVTKYVDIIFLTSYLFITFIFLRKRGASISTTLVGLLILLGSIANVYTRNGARPDVTGLFFSFSGFYLVFREKLTNADVVLSALLCIIAFYFKVYMIFIAPIILLYLFLFVSRGKSALFVLAGFIFAILSYLIIRHVFPTHYDITVMMQLFNEVTYIFTWMIRQTSYFIKYYWILIVILLFNLSVYLFSLFFSSRGKKKIPSLFYNKPIFRPIHFDIFDIGILVSVFVFNFLNGGT